jgi:hypothetical protein
VPFNKKKIVPINYTSRDFNSIKEDLLNYAKRYYPEKYKDFSEASFGSLMLDSVSYVGDVLSFYLDYSVNESFLETATEYENVLKLAKQLGYRRKGVPVSSGKAAFYITVPADSTGTGNANSPDLNYAPTLLKGTIIESTTGATFSLAEDVIFNSDSTLFVAASTNPTTGIPTSYALKAFGQVISGRIGVESFNIGEYESFPKIKLSDEDVVEVVSVIDSAGNKYYEVDFLSQDTVYFPVKNNEVNLQSEVLNSEPIYVLKPISVPRRFITESSLAGFHLQFGFGSDNDLTQDSLNDPSKVALKLHGKDYISESSFDPTKLLKGDKLGVAPSNTTITVIYRSNGPNDVNIPADSLSNISNPKFEFQQVENLSTSKVNDVITSLEVRNESPIVGSTREDSAEEIKFKAYGMFNSQNRAVTQQDYLSLIYSMPPKFGSVKRAAVVQDKNSFKRNLNIYVLSEDVNNNFVQSNVITKNNLKTWLSTNKMINDSIDILDANIINIGVEFSILSDTNYNAFEVLNNATQALKEYFLRLKFNIGEPIRYGDVFRIMKNVDGLLDVEYIKFVTKAGQNYSNPIFDIDMMTSVDGRMIMAPSDSVFEIKFPDLDIVGTVK